MGAEVTRHDIRQAAERLRGWVRETPVIRVEGSDFGLANPLIFKLEQLQHTGSFKVRGAANAILSRPVPPAGVVAASGGNHGAGVAYAAQRLGHPAEIFVPTTTPAVKVERLRAYGATVQLVGEHYPEALRASQARAAETGALRIHAYDQPEVVAGQGTLAVELERQAPEVDTILVAVGGGGLIGGVAGWYAGAARVVGVEPEGVPTMFEARRRGEPVDVAVSGIAADALGAGRIGAIGFAVAQRYVDRVVLVTDAAIVDAQRALWDELRLIAEPGGATAMAALLAGAYQPAPGERVAIVLCGGNTEPGTIV